MVLCLGVVTTALSLGYRLRNARLMRAHMLELGQQGRSVRISEARRRMQQHEWELAQTHRTKVVASLALLSVTAQGRTATALQCDITACNAQLSNLQYAPCNKAIDKNSAYIVCRQSTNVQRAAKRGHATCIMLGSTGAYTCCTTSLYGLRSGVAAAAGLPMSILNCYIIFVQHVEDNMARTSVC
jgi:hypothetical protein